MAGDTRDRMIEATVDALQKNGVAGMSFTEVLQSSGAARGAIYHHFPGGKAQLVAEAAERFGQDVRDNFAALTGTTPRDVVESFLALVRPVVAASAHGGGCAVAAVGVGSADDEGLRRVAADAFDSWVDQLAGHLAAAGLKREDATELATLLISLLEGAHVLCRSAGTVEPFERAARAAIALVPVRPPV